MEDAILLFKKLGAGGRAEMAQLDLAEILVKYAERLAGSGDFWSARSQIENAISRLPDKKDMKQRREEWYELLSLYSKKANENMEWKEAKVELPQDNKDELDRIAQSVAEAVRGRQFEEALSMLASFQQPVNADMLRDIAGRLQKNSLSSLVSTREIDHAGKTVGRDGPNSLGKHAAHVRFIFAGSMIRPAIVQIVDDHDVQLDDLLKVLEQKDFVPSYSRWTFASGLLAGLKFDLVAVAHVLPPMLENAFREMLASMGINTSRWDNELVSEEKSLKEILDHPAIGEILDVDLLFDLKNLLLKAEGGFNLRNRISHGLMTDTNFFPTEGGENNRELAQVIYLWWLALRLCFIIKRTDSSE